MTSTLKDFYDVIIIGAGLSGLAAGIRLTQFFKNVLIVESHTIPGGLNSYYEKGKPRQLFSSGLHTVTNATVTGRRWGLGLISRNLGVQPEEFKIAPPTRSSRITTPADTVRFSNDPQMLRSEISVRFPKQSDVFQAFEKRVIECSSDPTAAKRSALAFLHECFEENRLIELIFLPVMAYAGYAEHDIDLRTFSLLYRSLFLDGCGSPIDMKQFLNFLTEKFHENGGEIAYCKTVEAIHSQDGKAVFLSLKSGENLAAKFFLSSAGLYETGKLANLNIGKPGEVSLFQVTLSLNKPSSCVPIDDSVLFASRNTPLRWSFRKESDCMNVITCSAQDSYAFVAEKHHFKISCFDHISNWETLSRQEYHQKKQARINQLLSIATEYYPSLSSEDIVFVDTFSPTTIRRYTNHPNGTLYGGSVKAFDGRTPLENLFIIGNDQGGIGIMGAMTSGVLIVNYNILVG